MAELEFAAAGGGASAPSAVKRGPQLLVVDSTQSGGRVRFSPSAPVRKTCKRDASRRNAARSLDWDPISEVLLRTAFTGLCHSDLHFIEGLYPMPTPCVLGHEASAVVEAVGSEVSYVALATRLSRAPRYSAVLLLLHDRPPQSLRQHFGQDATREGTAVVPQWQTSRTMLQSFHLRRADARP